MMKTNEKGERLEMCWYCRNHTSDWVDPDWAPGRICRECETEHEPKEFKMNSPKDISTEKSRTYTWADGSTVTIDNPITLITSEKGHRIADAENNGHYVPLGWIHLKWINKPGAEAIVA